MKINTTLATLLSGATLMLSSLSANAGTVTYALPDIGTFTGYTNSTVSDTYSGNGFVGLYNTMGNGVPAWAHLFGVESTDYSRTLIQIDLSGLSGAASSAILGFSLLDGGVGPHGISVTGFGGTGALAYTWDAPAANFGSVDGTVVGGANVIDVAALLNAALAGGASYLDLLVQGTDTNDYMWTYTDPGRGFGADRAAASLTVTTGDVPEPTSMALFGVALAAAGLARRRKQS